MIVEVFLLATSQTGSTFSLTLSNLVPSGQSALATLTSSFTSGSTSGYGNVNRKINFIFVISRSLRIRIA